MSDWSMATMEEAPSFLFLIISVIFAFLVLRLISQEILLFFGLFKPICVIVGAYQASFPRHNIALFQNNLLAVSMTID